MALDSFPALGKEFLGYFLASLAALAVDMALLILFARFVHYTIAACASFLVGAGVHYLLSISLVFRRRRLLHRRGVELGIFLLSGVVALLLNVLVIALCVEVAGWSLPLSKLSAAGCSFLLGFLARKMLLF